MRRRASWKLTRKLSDLTRGGDLEVGGGEGGVLEAGGNNRSSSSSSSEGRPPLPVVGRASDTPIVGRISEAQSVPHVDDEGDEFFHGRSMHSVEVGEGEGEGEDIRLLREGEEWLGAMGGGEGERGRGVSGESRESQHMLTPHGSLSELGGVGGVRGVAEGGVEGALNVSVGSWESRSTANTVGTPNRHSTLCDDHHAIAEMFFGDAALLEKQHERKKKKRGGEKEAEEGEADVY